MKTSNKLLLVFFLALFFSAASLMVFAKSHMYVKTGDELEELYYGEGPIIEKTVLDDLGVNDIEMGDNFRFILDPTRSDVVIKGDSAFISKLKIVNDGQFRILTGGLGRNNNWPENLSVTIGVKNTVNPRMELSGNARVFSNDSLSYEKVTFDMNGNSNVDLDLSADHIHVEINGNSRLELNGSLNSLRTNQSGNSSLLFENIMLREANINLSGNAKFYGDIADNVTGHASGNGKIYFNEIEGIINISTSGNGKFTVRN